MRKNYGFNEEKNVNYIKRGIFFKVYAEEEKGGTEEKPEDKKPEGEDKSTEETPKTPNFNYEDLISKARKEEKDKLYPKITALEKEKADLIEKSNNSLLTIGELQTKLEEAEKKSTGSATSVNEEVANLKKALADKEAELKGLEETTEDISVVEERIRKELDEKWEVKLYREQVLRKAGENVIPELVMGETKEDVDNSLVASQNRFNQIVNQTISGVKIPPANTSVSNMDNANFNIEYLARIDPRSDEYRDLRKKLGLK